MHMVTEPTNENEEFELDDDALEKASGGFDDTQFVNGPTDKYASTFVPFDSSF